ncbi:MAG: hypothetical protein PF541_12920 [Prolixibacteraceae bacterium]|nr:hypothetical protein [Prolixibacteraceae bacterium]
MDNKTVYNIEFKDGNTMPGGEKIMQTYFDIIPIEESGGTVKVNIVDCSEGEPYRLEPGEEMAQYVKDHMISVDSLDIKRITKTSDADIYPDAFSVRRLMIENSDLQLCERNRNAFKVELRGMLGARSFKNIPYESIPGAVADTNQFIGFGAQGTKLIFGPEIAILAPVYKFNNRNRLHIGIMSGYWPVDGGNFIPISIHPRFTFNDITSPLFGICDALYLFGDIGTAYDFSADKNKFLTTGNRFVSSFYGFGVGVDLWKTKTMDISYDIAYRHTSLALPLNNPASTEWLDCLNENGIEYSDYNKRAAGQIVIRVGVTF